MIPARHNKWAQAVFHLYIMRSMKRHFHSFHLLGQEPDWSPHHPLIVLPNHCSWWDGFFLHLLNAQLWHRRPYLMMLEEQLSKHRFFSRLGVFSIEPDSAAGIRKSLHYSRAMLKNKDHLMCIFPQGELLPWQQRPLGYKPGVLWLLDHCDCEIQLVQLGIKIEYLLQQRPQVFFQFSEPLFFAGTALTLHEIESRHALLLDDMNQRIVRQEESTILLHGRKSVNDQWLKWRTLWQGRSG